MQTLGCCFLSWTGELCAPAVTKLNPFALPHRVIGWLHCRARRLRRTVKVQLSMALHDSLFYMTSDVARRSFLAVSQTWVCIATWDR